MNSRTLPALLLLLAYALPAQAASDERARFKLAYAEARVDGPRAAALARGLEKYSLYPYLQFEALRRDLASLPVAPVEAFLLAHHGTYLAAKLRDVWLRELGRQHQWALFDHFYQTTPDGDLACISLRAKLELGSLKQFNKLARLLWLQPKSQSAACEPVFTTLHQQGLLPNALVRERVWLALGANRPQFASYLLRAFAPPARAALVLRLEKHPEDAAQMPELRADSRDNRALIGYAITQLAGHDAERARALWLSVRKHHAYSADGRAILLRTIALAGVAQTKPSALAMLDEVPRHLADAALERASLRVALAAQDWVRLERWTTATPFTPANRLRLSYWHARALAELGRHEPAKAAFAEIAKERDYYGFLASDRLGVAYSLTDHPIAPLPRETRAINAVPGIAHALEFEQLGLHDESVREWRWTLDQLSRREVEVAARLAYDWGWFDRAIAALGKIEAYNDLTVRFPLLYKDQVLAAADQRDMSPARVYSILRGESAFVGTARSPAGALGLMQLMPATAAETARRTGITLNDPRDILAPDKNILLGSAYLRQVMGQFESNFALAAAAYNAGAGRVKSWLPKQSCVPADVWVEAIPFAETEAYVRRALFYAAIYEKHLGMSISRLSSELTAFTLAGQVDHC